MPRRRNQAEDPEVEPAKKKKRRVVEPESSSPEESEDEPQSSLFEASDKENADQNVSPPKSIHSFRHEGRRAGTIEKIHLRNFMCHANLMIELNKHINLLVGCNGSGKSAIITALAIGLGAKAQTTNRSTSLKQLIKNGESSATIEIYMYNDGVDAYRQDEYGSKIIVSRTLLASGGGGYKLKNEHGRIVSQKRDDLVRMLSCLNIQVDNPIVLLNQDAARSFLKDSDPKKLYELFLKATQIDLIIQKLDECAEHIVAASSSLKSNKTVLQAKEAELRNLEEKRDVLKSLETLKEERDKLKMQVAWAQVREMEPSLRKVQGKVEKVSQEMDELGDMLRNKDNIDAEINQKLKTIEEQIQKKQESLGVEENNVKEARSALTRKDEELQSQKGQVKKYETKRAQILEDIKQIEEALKQQDKAAEIAELRKQHERELKKVTSQKEEVEVMLQNNSRELEMTRNTLARDEELIETQKSRHSQIDAAISKTSVQIRNTSDSNHDTLTVYGARMPQLVKRIEQEFKRGKFSKLPRGPLGRYIEVPDPRWRMPIEQICGNTLTAFFCNTNQDRVTLNNLVKREFPEMPAPTFYTSKFSEQPYDVRDTITPAPPGSMNVLKAMRVKDPVVLNCLIDQCRLENILMTEEQDRAFQLCEEERNVPSGMTRLYLTTPFSEFFPAPNYRSYSLKPRPTRFIVTNREEIRANYEAQLQKEKSDLEVVQRNMQELRKKTEENWKHIREFEQHASVLERKKRECESKIREIRNYEYPEVNSAEYLLKDLRDLQGSLSQVEQFLSRERLTSEAIGEKISKLNQELDRFKEAKRGIERELQDLQSKMGQERDRLYELASNNRTQQAKLARLKEEAQEAQEMLTKALAEYKKKEAEAEKLGRRVPATQSVDVLLKKQQKIEAHMKQISQQKETLDELEVKISVREQEKELLLSVVNNLHKTVTLLVSSRKDRYQQVRQLKNQFAQTVAFKFHQIMRLRGFQGACEFDWQSSALHLRIRPREDQGQNTNTKSLSGGERSFSTVALLIALWCCIDHPFYFLDEYDVFTDPLNRHIMTMLLIDAAEKKGDQFALLTPQDMSQFRSKPNLTIHKFADPVRC